MIASLIDDREMVADVMPTRACWRGNPSCRIAEKLHLCENAAMRIPITITNRGVITLPAKLRQALGVKAEDQLIAEITSEGLLLRPAVTLPVEMYSPERVREFDTAEDELAQVQKPPVKSPSARKGTARRSR